MILFYYFDNVNDDCKTNMLTRKSYHQYLKLRQKEFACSNNNNNNQRKTVTSLSVV